MNRLHYLMIAVIVACSVCIIALTYKVQILNKEIEEVKLENIKLNVKLLQYQTKEVEQVLETDPALDAYLRAHKGEL
jgi:cell division protein FtsL